jgi:rare lipoprotein A
VLGALIGCAHPAPQHATFRDVPVQEGMASYYGAGFAGRPTASGERFDPRALTAAHRTLPFGTCVRVDDLDSRRHVAVRVNDRGPYAKARIIDVSEEAARELGMLSSGTARVRLSGCGR